MSSQISLLIITVLAVRMSDIGLQQITIDKAVPIFSMFVRRICPEIWFRMLFLFLIQLQVDGFLRAIIQVKDI